MAGLEPLPEGFAETCQGLHAIAERIVAPAQKPDNEIALMATPGGFGTPAFEWDGATHQIRVDGIELVHSAGGNEEREPIESLAQASSVVEGLVPEPPKEKKRLHLDEPSARALAGWYEFGDEVLRTLSGEAREDASATEPILWPEHFDVAIESGDEGAGARANVGFSPGDSDHPDPYLYVGPWEQDVRGDLWNATGFTGAELSYDELQAAEDPRGLALEFCRERLAALNG